METNADPCLVCHGEGLVWVSEPKYGTGYIVLRTCHECDGTGRKEEEQPRAANLAATVERPRDAANVRGQGAA